MAIQVKVLVVAGGGGSGGKGNGNSGGGGGAGGVVYDAAHVVTIRPYTVTVGTGGAGSLSGAQGTNGNDSVFDTITAVGRIVRTSITR